MASTSTQKTPQDPSVIDADTTEYSAEIPSKLYEVVTAVYDRLQSAHFERKFGNTWRSAGKRFRYGSPPPTQTVEDICSQCIAVVTTLTEKAGKDIRFRLVLTYTDISKATKVARRFVPIEAEIMEDGEVLVRDASEMGDRDYLAIMRDVIEKQDARMDDLFGRVMEMMDKNNEASDRQIQQASTYSKGIAEVGTSLGGIVTTVMKVLEQATQLTAVKEKEHVAVQLAKMDAEASQMKMQGLLALLNKVGGPIAKQIANVLGGEKATPVAARVSRPALSKPSTAATVAATVAAAATTEAPATEVPAAVETTERTSCERLTLWLAGLEDDAMLQMRDVVGVDHFEAFVAASESGSVEQTDAALRAFKKAFDVEAKANPEAVGAKLLKLGEILGDEATEAFAAMLPNPED